MKVKKQLILMSLGFSILPILIITTIYLSTSISTIENLHINRLNAITHTAASAYNEIVKLRKEEVDLISDYYVFQDYIKSLEQNTGDSDDTEAKRILASNYLKNHIDSTITFDDAVFLDADGVVVIAYNDEVIGRDLSENDYFIQAKNGLGEDKVCSGKIQKSLIYPEDPDKYCLALSQAFFSSDGRFQGTLVAYVNAYIMAEFSRSISFGKTGLSFVIDSDNYILYHPESRFYNAYTTSPQLSNLWQRWKANEIPGTGAIYGMMDGKRRIYYYEVMSDIELILLLRQDYDEFSADRNVTVLSAVISGALSLIIAVILGIRLSNRFMKPIMMLKNAFSSADKLGSYVICELPVKNELGDMAESYNSMIMKLERQYELLKIEKEKNEYIAKHDKLTGMLNRQSLEQELGLMLNNKESFGVFFVDLDEFKEINDVYGHAAGDSLLRQIGERFHISKADFDLCARIGGDEFILSKFGTVKEMRKYAKILLNELNKPYIINGLEVSSNACIGISMYPNDADNVDKLVANADIAMYKAKESGKNTFKVYNYEMRDEESCKTSAQTPDNLELIRK